jgi:hypothetical protein
MNDKSWYAPFQFVPQNERNRIREMHTDGGFSLERNEQAMAKHCVLAVTAAHEKSAAVRFLPVGS